MKRISGYIPDELHSDIEEIAKRDIRSFTATISLLLQQAVKERNRKRVRDKKDDIRHNPSDAHQNNSV